MERRKGMVIFHLIGSEWVVNTTPFVIMLMIVIALDILTNIRISANKLEYLFGYKYIIIIKCLVLHKKKRWCYCGPIAKV